MDPVTVIDWAVAGRPFPGERVSGDIHVVEPLDEGALVAVIDALGHGEDAAATSRLAAETVRAHAHEDIASVVHACHARLRAVRGVVMSAASFDARHSMVTWGGIGNVEGFLLRSRADGRPIREALVMRSGVIGFQIPEVRAMAVPVTRGDVLVFATDGIAHGFVEACRGGTPQQIADSILTRYGKSTDDALVLVAVYRGAAA
jgi:phosphoserine phosphatase RsbX